MKILSYIWQLPQNILGLLILLVEYIKTNKKVYKYKIKYDDTEIKYYVSNSFYNSGISLGSYIIFDKHNVYDNSVKHEHGHQIQSKYLGPLYLFIIGIPSFLNNIYSRTLIGKISSEERLNKYYNFYTEKWANKLGGVNR